MLAAIQSLNFFRVSNDIGAMGLDQQNLLVRQQLLYGINKTCAYNSFFRARLFSNNMKIAADESLYFLSCVCWHTLFTACK